MVKKPIKESAPTKRIHAIFYASDSGNEPVKEALLELGRRQKRSLAKTFVLLS